MREFILFCLLGIFVSGCATDCFKDRAADRAREYIYDNCPNMSVQNESYIKYTYPRILSSPIFITSKTGQELNQICFVWDLPSPKVSIIVVGSCNNYFDWYPLRLLIKKTEEIDAKVAKEDSGSTVKDKSSF